MKKSTLINGFELDRYLEIREMIKEYPNDMELGGKIRSLFKETRDKKEDNAIKYKEEQLRGNDI